jgi:hypothetical protein
MVTYGASRCGPHFAVTSHLAGDPTNNGALDATLCFCGSGKGH